MGQGSVGVQRGADRLMPTQHVKNHEITAINYAVKKRFFGAKKLMLLNLGIFHVVTIMMFLS